MRYETIIKTIIKKIKNDYRPDKIIVYGSYAWGKPSKDSDLDLLIIKKTALNHRHRMLQVREILSKENALLAMDILVYTPREIDQRLRIGDSFIRKILRQGNVVYG